MKMDSGALSGRVDRDDAFLDGDIGFTALNVRAGGVIGKPLAVPQLATVARLARRLGILVSRSITIADGDADVDCWVRAVPGDHGVTVTIADLRERSPTRPREPAASPTLPPPGADWTWETDAALRVTHVSIEAGARYGFDAVAALGQPVTRLFALESDETLTARRDFDGLAASLRGSTQKLHLGAVARRNPAGKFAGFVGGAFVDRPSVDDSVESPLPDIFSARLDTILRAPLGRIVANADSMNAQADGPLSAHYVDYAADIASAGRHLMGLIDDLVDLQAIEREDFVVEAEKVDLADVARRASGLLSVRAADAGVGIDRPQPETPVFAVGEFRRTLQVMVNLIGNAVRYSPSGTNVAVSVVRIGDAVIATVVDHGKGIAQADQKRIFEKFARVDSSEPGGSGLGLYIARRLARAMGGDLTLESEPGHGARFAFTLPAA